MTGIFPDLGYLIFLFIIACIILPIFSLMMLNIKLYAGKVKIKNRIFYSSIFLVLFFAIQKVIIEAHSTYFIHILEIENILTIILSFILLVEIKKSQS